MKGSVPLLSFINTKLRTPEPEFVNLLRSPGIDSQPGGLVRQPYLMYRDQFLGVDSWAPETFSNTGSVHLISLVIGTGLKYRGI
jgi:hypothetical protein